MESVPPPIPAADEPRGDATSPTGSGVAKRQSMAVAGGLVAWVMSAATLAALTVVAGAVGLRWNLWTSRRG